MRVKGALMDHKEIRAAMGVRVVAPGLEHAVAGTSLFVIRPEDDEEELRATVRRVEGGGIGVLRVTVRRRGGSEGDGEGWR